ncbi:MAG: APC family permease [Actinobacteria bacterium]|nr:APC family permease [Actinomycetota bacterium]
MKAQTTLKRLAVGPPKSSEDLEETLLRKVLALPIFASDALSSVAYATQEILLVLAVAGTTALTNVVPIAGAVGGLLAILILSYRQTVHAYPNGGGAYIVAHENLGAYPGLLAASALLIDYVLTVAVSIVAGVDAIVSAVPGLATLKIIIAVALVVFVTLANLRGVKEAGTFFAVPSYGFILSIGMVLAFGFSRCLDSCPMAESAGTGLPVESPLSPFMVLTAFAAGTTALTGVEAISNGVQAFREPKSKNAATTLGIMGAIAITMFLGISLLARLTHVVFIESAERTVLAQIAHAVLGGGPLFYVVQVATAAILILAANTAYQGFPRLASVLASDGYMPHQFNSLGDRLAYSNGIVILAALASLLIVIFKANLTSLIQLYLVGVFLSFTLSQFGMVLHWRRTRESGWQRNLTTQAVGAVATAIVLCVVVVTKFLHGAWVVVAMIPVLVFLMRSVKEHYDHVGEQLAEPARRPHDRVPGNQHMVILVNQSVDGATARAVGYALAIPGAEVSGVTFSAGHEREWNVIAPGIELEVIRKGGLKERPLLEYLHKRRETLGADDFLTVVVPEVLQRRSLMEVITHPSVHRLKADLLNEPGIQVLDIPLHKDEVSGDIGQEARRPEERYVVVLLSGVHNATLQAIEYAETLQGTETKGLYIAFDDEGVDDLRRRWEEANIPHRLEIEMSPYRDVGTTVAEYVRRRHADGRSRVVTLVLPEYVVEKRRHQLLHNQTALIIKGRMLLEPDVVVVSVPYIVEG